MLVVDKIVVACVNVNMGAQEIVGCFDNQQDGRAEA